MSIRVMIDGELRAPGQEHISVLDRGFLYGDSVFEVMRTYEGVPFAEREHLERLAQSAQRLLFEVPVGPDVLHDEIAQTLSAAENPDSYVRVVVTRGSGPLNYDPTTAEGPRRIVIAAPLVLPPAELYTQGAPVVLVRASRPTEDRRAAGVKASNYLSNLLAVHEAKQRGGYEAILLGAGGEVLEGATTNIFVVHGGRIRTPRLETGILAGVTRATVLEQAVRAGLEPEESVVFPADLYTADEVFITSTIREVVPVVAVDGRSIGAGRPGPVTQQLRTAFQEAVRRRTKKG